MPTLDPQDRKTDQEPSMSDLVSSVNKASSDKPRGKELDIEAIRIGVGFLILVGIVAYFLIQPVRHRPPAPLPNIHIAIGQPGSTPANVKPGDPGSQPQPPNQSGQPNNAASNPAQPNAQTPQSAQSPPSSPASQSSSPSSSGSQANSQSHSPQSPPHSGPPKPGAKSPNGKPNPPTASPQSPKSNAATIAAAMATPLVAMPGPNPHGFVLIRTPLERHGWTVLWHDGVGAECWKPGMKHAYLWIRPGLNYVNLNQRHVSIALPAVEKDHLLYGDAKIVDVAERHLQ